MKLSDLRISAKLGGAFTALILLTIGVSAFAIAQLATINGHTTDIATNWLPSIEELGDLSSTMNRIRRAENDLVLNAGGDATATIEGKFTVLGQQLKDELAKYQAMLTPGAEQQAFDVYRKHLDQFWVTHDKLEQTSRGGDKSLQQTRSYLWGESRSAFDTAFADLGQLVTINDKGAAAAYESAQSAYAQVRVWVLSLLACTIVVAALLARWITRLVTVPVALAVNAAKAIAAGDLTVPVKSEGGDEIGQLLRAIADMQGNLVSIVSGVRRNAEGVATASGQIAQGNVDLSSRTEQQTSSLQETAATMEELSATVRNNADSAKEANRLATSAAAFAATGGEVVAQVVSTMKEINQSSKKIAEIIGVIDGIAFQTNLLALNAAVEAARAGEQGRGFAVVASEVRNLARRSAEAAKEIKTLITSSVDQVERGSQLVDQAGLKMNEIVEAIKRVHVVAGEISNSSVEQSNGVTQVCQVVSQMDQATQQNAALVEESAAAAENLKQQASQLVEAVGVFKLDGSAAPPAATAGTSYSGAERRGPGRATNVARPRFGSTGAASPAKSDLPGAAVEPGPLRTGSDDWHEF